MSECVVRMEMPSDCERCPMCGTASGGNGMYELWCMCGDIPANSQKRPEDCPIICQLPEGHGRLVDADAMAKCLEYDCELDARGLDDMTIVGHEREHLQFDKDCKQNCMWYLTEQETIVPAERSEK